MLSKTKMETQTSKHGLGKINKPVITSRVKDAYYKKNHPSGLDAVWSNAPKRDNPG